MTHTATSTMTEHPSIDPEALDRLRDWGGEKLVGQMLRLFLENSPLRMDQIRGGVSSGDLSEAEKGAHSLKSSAANVGARHLREAAAEMESLALEEDVAAVESLMDRLEDAYAAARSELEAIEQGMPQ